MAEDYYAILGVEPGAPQAEIQRAYRRLARRYHPDASPREPEAGKRFVQITEAYEMLCKPAQRRSKGARHTVLSAFLTVRYQPDTHRRDRVMADSEFVTSLVGMATVIWLFLICVCWLMMMAAASPGAAGGDFPVPNGDGDLASARQVVGVVVGLVTLFYAAFVVIVIVKCRPT